eukprot:2009016-Amphidinium_carterae.1
MLVGASPPACARLVNINGGANAVIAPPFGRKPCGFKPKVPRSSFDLVQNQTPIPLHMLLVGDAAENIQP